MIAASRLLHLDNSLIPSACISCCGVPATSTATMNVKFDLSINFNLKGILLMVLNSILSLADIVTGSVTGAPLSNVYKTRKLFYVRNGNN